jgi:hypothetical protein
MEFVCLKSFYLEPPSGFVSFFMMMLTANIGPEFSHARFSLRGFFPPLSQPVAHPYRMEDSATNT